MKRLLNILIIIAISLSLLACDKKEVSDTIILFTNDVHCTDDDGLTYALIGEYKEDQAAIYGKDNVTLVDTGDAIQGGMLGAFSKGKYIVDLMNITGYDLAVPGNHEFDYGVDNFMKLVEEYAEYGYLCANFTDINGDDLLDAYRIIEYGDRKIAYLGILTPDTLTSVNPKYFKDDNGKYLYSFYNDAVGTKFYERIQTIIDMIEKEDVDYIIALAHLGQDETHKSKYSSNELLAHTSGIDILIDGHSHENYNTMMKDKNGNDVLVAQTGTKGKTIGKIHIDKEDEINIEMIDTASIQKGDKYDEIYDHLEDLHEKLDDVTGEVIGTSEYDLVISDVLGERIIRSKETNLGDLCADAYRMVLDTDLAIVNGGGIRTDILAGDITYGDLINVHPFANLLCTAQVSGQMIIDCLEMGAKDLPNDDFGGFMQVSGIKYTIDTTITSNVKVDENGNFLKVDGPYRVSNVMVLDQSTDRYTSLDPEATYTLAATNYTIKSYGDGMTMFKGAKIVMDEVMLDSEVLINYIVEYLDGTIPQTYADTYGSGRINIID